MAKCLGRLWLSKQLMLICVCAGDVQLDVLRVRITRPLCSHSVVGRPQWHLSV